MIMSLNGYFFPNYPNRSIIIQSSPFCAEYHNIYFYIMSNLSYLLNLSLHLQLTALFSQQVQELMHKIISIPKPATTFSIKLQEIKTLAPVYNGQYCDVFKITKDGKEYAVKIVNTDRIEEHQLQDEMGRVYNEIKALYSLKHQGIIQLLGHFVQDNKIGLIFPYFGKPISQFIREKKKKNNGSSPLTLKQFIYIFRNIGSAIYQLYVKGYVHRDISEDNILINQNLQTKLIDFGFVGAIQNCKGRLGTREFFAPQIILGKKYNHKVDVWSFGILCYEIIFGLYMFRPKNKNLEQNELDEQYLINMKQPIEDPPDEKLILNQKPGDQILSYIKSMLNFNPDKRPQIGYLISKKVFGAELREAETYSINQYVRQKTFRKSNNTQMYSSQNIKQMFVFELQQTLLDLVHQYSIQNQKKKQLMLDLLQQQKKLCLKKKEFYDWKNKKYLQ